MERSSLPESDESGISRRNLLKIFAATAAGIVLTPQEARAESVTEPEVKSAIFEPFRVPPEQRGALREGFTRLGLYVNDRLYGSIIRLENNHAHADLLTKKRDGILDFDTIAARFKAESKHVVLQCAAAFTEHWEIPQGIAYQKGKPVGESLPKPYGGLLVITQDNRPTIRTEDLTNQDKLTDFQREAEAKKLSAIQQMLFIDKGSVLENVQKGGARHKRRFFVKTEVGKFGVVNFTKETTLHHAAQVLDEAGIEKAILLDTGAVSPAKLYAINVNDKVNPPVINDKVIPLGEEDDDFSMYKYTNMLVLYSETKVAGERDG